MPGFDPDSDRAPSDDRLHLDGVEIEPGARRIRKNGRDVPLEPRAFDLLVLLASNPGRVLTKDELLDRVWADRVVSEGTLYRAVRLVRQVFGSEGERIIQTVHGRGYRCMPPDRVVPERDPPQRRRALAAAAIVVVSIMVAGWAWLARMSRAFQLATVRPVLPFAASSGDAETNFLGEALAEELVSGLRRIGDLDVVGTTSSFATLSADTDLESIGRRLGAERILRGTWREAAGELLVHAELHDPGTGRLLWSRSFERERDALSELRDALVRAVVERLDSSGRNPAGEPLPIEGPADATAYTLFLRARNLWRTRDASSLDEARALLELAVAREPGFARAHEALASLWIVLPSWQTVDPQRARGLAYAAAREALRLEPRLGEARAVLAQQARAARDWETADRLFGEAMRREPTNPTILHWHAEYLLQHGRLDEAANIAERAIETDRRAGETDAPDRIRGSSSVASTPFRSSRTSSALP